MYISLLFWALLLLPGYCLVHRFWRDDLDSGLLGVIAVSYLASLALLSPVSVICYVANLPVWVLSAAYVAAVAAAVVELWRRAAGRDLWRLLTAALGVELAVVLVDAALGARVGALTVADARVHLARIRFMLDHGFNNLDPFVAEPHFFPIYHTNLLHALHAACTQLTGVDHLGVWHVSLTWAKLLVASGVYYMVWCVLGTRTPAWAGAMFAVGLWAPMTYLIYPNKLGALWLLPCILGAAIRTARQAGGWHDPTRVALGVWLLAQVHSLYAIFAGLVLGPTLLGAMLLAHFRRTGNANRLAACTVALFLAAPFVLVSIYTEAPGRGPDEPVTAALSQTDRNLIAVPGDWAMLNPGSTRLGRARNLLLLAAGLACAMWLRRRSAALLMLAVLLTIAAIFFVPPLCTFVLAGLRKVWILRRMGIVVMLAIIAIGVGGIAALIEMHVRRRWARAAAGLAFLALGMFWVRRTEPFTWNDYLQRSFGPWGVRGSYVAAQRQARDLLARFVRPGATVLTELEFGVGVVAVYDCHLVATSTSSAGVPDLGRRRHDLETLLAPETPWPVRLGLLRKYDITHYMSHRPDPAQIAWMKDHHDDLKTSNGLVLVALSVN